MADIADVVKEGRGLLEADWLVSASWNRLHHADLTDDQCAELVDECTVHDVRLACGRRAKWVSIPGVFTRMGADRCTGCCRATGLPPGAGSPKNDPACRELLGLPPSAREQARRDEAEMVA
jgi:hypothetical protein